MGTAGSEQPNEALKPRRFTPRSLTPARWRVTKRVDKVMR
jgi:hypothetical protein